MLIAGACKRPDIPWQEKANSEKEFYKEHRCCSIQDSRGNDDSSKKCCYEMYQSGEGPNIQHHLEMNIASVTRDAMNPAFEAARAEIEAGSSSEEIAKAVLGEYQKANEKFTLNLKNAVLEKKTSREAKEQAAEKALVEEQAVLRSREVREELKYHNMDHRKRYLCSYYDEGECWHSESEDCEDAHGEEELRLYQQAWFDTKTKLESQLEKCLSVI